MSKQATPDHPIHELLAARWSPYAYADRPVAAEDLRSILEAARWAPSSYNEQPWSYIVATKDGGEEYEHLLSCLVPPNQAWANAAPVLMLAVVTLNFTRNGKPNAAAVHDIGLASGTMCLEATARGISVHQMIGILPDVARETYGIPDGSQAVTALAFGYAADPETADEGLRERDQVPRSRKPLGEFVFSGSWGSTASLVT